LLLTPVFGQASAFLTSGENLTVFQWADILSALSAEINSLWNQAEDDLGKLTAVRCCGIRTWRELGGNTRPVLFVLVLFGTVPRP
jgi:hypothetical protein